MHELILAGAFRPPRVVVLGCELAPFSLAHVLVLAQRRSALVGLGDIPWAEMDSPAQWRALGEAVVVCQQPVRRRWWQVWRARSAGRVASGSDAELAREVNAFQAYLAANGQDLPSRRPPRGSSKEPFHYFGAPELARLIQFLQAHHGQLLAAHFEGSPLNVPLGLARVLYTTWLECEGAVWVENAFDVRDKQRRATLDAMDPEQIKAMIEKSLAAERAAVAEAVAKAKKNQ